MERKELLERLRTSQKYRLLANRHRRVIYLLTGIAVFQYGLYFLTIAWAKELAGAIWPEGSAVSVIMSNPYR